ncbi:DUF3785 family protein [Clostridium sp. BJN0001]|uniref:DUF3785 family protein n=1 Tax=Clostridium sp. BJN0001 TaxID=2930219 RepID=UPI001FD44F5D|nr:DUF3785 family protein [Clostridium sp. BJN0001]
MEFEYNSKKYLLNEENCDGFFNDENNEVKDISLEIVLDSLSHSKKSIDFSKEYYASKCPCEKQEAFGRAYPYLEYHFYIYTKNNAYVINDICPEYENTTFTRLQRAGKVDNSYIVSLIVCPECGRYTVELEECLV